MRKLSFAQKISLLAKLGFAVMVCTVVFSLVSQNKAHALTLNPNLDNFWIPDWAKQSLERCDQVSPIRSPGFTAWLGLKDYPAVNSVTVEEGTASVDLRLTWAAVVCLTSSSVSESRSVITRVPPGAESMWLQTYSINFGNRAKSIGALELDSKAFTYSPPGGFKTSGWYTVEFSLKQINHFTTGVYQCVGRGDGDTPPVNGWNWGGCPTEPKVTLNFYVDVKHREPTIGIDANGSCQAISGWAWDEDAPYTPLRTDVWLDGPAGVGQWITSLTANQPSPDVNAIYPITGNSPHRFSLDIRPLIDYRTSGPRTFYLYFANLDQSGNQEAWELRTVTVDIPTCGVPFSLTPKGSVKLQRGGVPEDEDPDTAVFTDVGINASPETITGVTVTPRYEVRKVDGTVIVLGPSPGSFTGVTVGASGANVVTSDSRGLAGLVAGDRVCLVVTIDPGAGRISRAGAIIDSTIITTDVDCKRISNKPYLSVYSGDVYSGGNFAVGSVPACRFTAGISANTNSLNFGSGTQLAATALGTILGFNSASLRTGGTPVKPSGLDFANTTSPPGNFDPASHCIKDYFADKKGGAIPGNLSSLTAGNHDFQMGDTTLGNITIQKGAHIRLFVEGTLTINGNISFNTTDSRASQADIPSLQIVARNINIISTVEQLDGVYVAEPNVGGHASQGFINTCSDVTNKDNWFSACNKQLVVNGSFIANKVQFLRTFGSQRNASGDSPFGGIRGGCANDTGSGNERTCAGEIFNFTPELYLTAPNDGAADSSADEFNMTLPPVL